MKLFKNVLNHVTVALVPVVLIMELVTMKLLMKLLVEVCQTVCWFNNYKIILYLAQYVDGVCVFNDGTSLTTCKNINNANTYEDCSSLNTENCINCENAYGDCPLRNSLLACSVTNRKCTQQECASR